MRRAYAKTISQQADIRLVPMLMTAITAAALCLMFLFSPAAAQDTAPVNSFETGYAAYQDGDFYEARRIWETAAAEGDARALYNLGTLYAEGRGVNFSMTTAEEYWQQAAEAGHVRAMHNLALAHITDAGSMEPEAAAAEYGQALRWLEQAAADSFPNSQYTLGKMYQYGLNVPQSDARAAEYYMLAAEQGFANAQYNLGKAYRDGRGVPQDDAASIRYFQMAAENGHARAQNRLATRYARGDGVEQDDVTALFWATLAANGGAERAAENVRALRARMTDAQIADAETRVANWLQN